MVWLTFIAEPLRPAGYSRKIAYQRGGTKAARAPRWAAAATSYDLTVTLLGSMRVSLGVLFPALSLVIVCLAAAPANACEALPRLTPTNTFIAARNTTGSCVFTPGSCATGQIITLSVGTFGATLECCPHEFEWDFGDGATITTETNGISHIYSTSGTHQVSVRVTGCGDTSQLDGTQLLLQQPVMITAVVPLLSATTLSVLALALAGLGAMFSKT
jgi:hypothetical protein